MLTSVRSLLAASILATSAFAAAPAMAQDAGSGITVSGNAAIVTDYRFRGVSLSDGDFAVQGGIDVAHDSGFYIGTWGSSLASFDNMTELDDGAGTVGLYDVGDYGAVEIDVYAGWSGDITDGLTFDIGALYYLYPNATNRDALVGALGPSGYPTFGGYSDFDTDYLELYTSLGTSLGPVSATLGAAYAPEQDSLGGDDNLYIYLDLESGIPGTPLTLSGHLGYTSGVLAPEALATGTDDTGFDYSIGASFAFNENLSLGVAWIGTDATSIDDFTDDAIVGTLSVSF